MSQPSITIDTELCIGCRLCATLCPTGVLDLAGDYCAAVVDLDQCLFPSCGLCEESCVENAIRIEQRQ